MLRIFAALAATLTMSTAFCAQNASSNENQISDEQVALSRNLPATVVVRVAAEGEDTEMLQSKQALPAGIPVEAAISQLKGEFVPVMADSKVPMNELDRDSSNSSWYLYFYNRTNWYPCYYYGNYNYYYAPYWSYYNAGYWYYYYRWSW